MQVSYYTYDNILIIIPMGEFLDAKNSMIFKEKVLDIILQTGILDVVLSLANLHFVDSSGLGALLSLKRLLNSQGGAIKLCCINKPVSAMFEIVSIHYVFEMFSTTEEAIESFKK